MADIRRKSIDNRKPFVTTVRAGSVNYSSKLLPKLEKYERRGSNPKNRINRHPKILGRSKRPRISAWNAFNEKMSNEISSPEKALKDDNEIEKKIVSNLETHRRDSKVGFGVAFQISKLIGKFRRRNSPVKLPPLREYVHDHEDPLGIVPVLPVKAEAEEIFRPFVHTSSRLSLRSSNSSINARDSPRGGGGGSGKSFYSNKHQQNTWSFLRNRLVQAKMSDVFSNIRFTVNGKSIRALRCIGEGGYSKVYEVFDDANKLMALKVVNLNDTKCKDELMAEIEFLKELKHCEKVIRMIDYEIKDDIQGLPFLDEPDRDDEDLESKPESKSYVFLLLEHGEADLEQIIKSLKEKKNFTVSKMKYYWEQMLEAVAEVHANNIIHADIKPANFVLVKGQLKIIDFGFAMKIDEKVSNRRGFVAGTRDYLSPEIFSVQLTSSDDVMVEETKEKNLTELTGKVDIWALGIILFQWVYDSRHPYVSLPGGKKSRNKALVTLDVPITLESLADPFLWDTLKLCLEKRAENRAYAKQLLRHPYLNPISF